MKNISLFSLLIIVFASFQTKAQCVNFTKYQPGDRDNAIVISAIAGTNVSETNFYFDQTLYLDVTIINNGSCDAPKPVTANVFLDGVFKTTLTYATLLKNQYQPKWLFNLIQSGIVV